MLSNKYKQKGKTSRVSIQQRDSNAQRMWMLKSSRSRTMRCEGKRKVQNYAKHMIRAKHRVKCKLVTEETKLGDSKNTN